ncbi:MAG: DUF4199 family protein [Ignavibacteriae bacterium]|nr:DUF4199 family protein [Ignavibacteriota bacterium]
MKKYLPVLVTGFAAGVLHIVPIVKGLTCCLVVPVAAYFAIVLYQKSNNNFEQIDLRKGATLGILTGVIAAIFGSFFDIAITLITKNNDILNSFNQLTETIDMFPFPRETKDEVLNLMQTVVTSIRETGFSLLYATSIFVNNLIVNPIFGLIGGLVGAKILNSKNSN